MSQPNSLALCWWRNSGSGRLPVLYVHAISLSPRELFLVNLASLQLCGISALYWLGPLFCLLIHFNFLALARKHHCYYTASNLPPLISFNLPGTLFSHVECDLCLCPPLALISRGCTLLFLISFSLLSFFSENLSINPNCCNSQWEASNLVVIDLNNANINEWKTH